MGRKRRTSMGLPSDVIRKSVAGKKRTRASRDSGKMSTEAFQDCVGAIQDCRPSKEPPLPVLDFNEAQRSWRENKTDYEQRGEFEYKSSRRVLLKDPLSGYYYWAEMEQRGKTKHLSASWCPPFSALPTPKHATSFLTEKDLAEGVLVPHPTSEFHRGEPIEFVLSKPKKRRKPSRSQKPIVATICKEAGVPMCKEPVAPPNSVRPVVIRCRCCTFPVDLCKCEATIRQVQALPSQSCSERSTGATKDLGTDEELSNDSEMGGGSISTR